MTSSWIKTWHSTIAFQHGYPADTIQHIPKYHSLCFPQRRNSINLFCQNAKIDIISVDLSYHKMSLLYSDTKFSKNSTTTPGERLNVKNKSMNRNFHSKDQWVMRPSHLYNGHSYTDKTSLYWDGPLTARHLSAYGVMLWYILYLFFS